MRAFLRPLAGLAILAGVVTPALAIDPHASTAPRPISIPSTISAAKAWRLQAAASPTGTTSVWPAKQRFGPAVP